MKTIARRFGLTTLAFVLGTTLGSAAIGTAWASTTQPHMQSALWYLEQAAAQLNAATPDKGGHRANAISLVNQAIEQTRWGINYAR